MRKKQADVSDLYHQNWLVETICSRKAGGSKKKIQPLDWSTLYRRRAVEGDEWRTGEEQSHARAVFNFSHSLRLAFLGDKDLPQYLRKLEEQIEGIKQEIVKMQSAQILYTNFINIATEKHSCPLCEQNLDSVDEFVEKLENKLAAVLCHFFLLNTQVPHTVQVQTKELKKTESAKKKLVDLQPHWSTVSRLDGEEIPNLKNKLDNFGSSEAELKNSMDQLTESMKKLEVSEVTSFGILPDIPSKSLTISPNLRIVVFNYTLKWALLLVRYNALFLRIYRQGHWRGRETTAQELWFENGWRSRRRDWEITKEKQWIRYVQHQFISYD